MDSVTDQRVRPVTVEDLGIRLDEPEVASAAEAERTTETIEERPPVQKLDATDKHLVEVRAALDLGFAGVILSGPPGTGKTYYAERIAQTLAGSPDAVTTVQFHASYQYEDFMQGFAPKEDGSGFELVDKVFVLACKDAIARETIQHVIVIEEMSRCDVARVFGEALTYMEVDKRGKGFTLASGDPMIVPPNLIILATMNPWDKGVDELDVALERRFAQVDMPPDRDALRTMLNERGGAVAFVDRVVQFFDGVQKMDDELVHLGHAYFARCTDEDSARRLWSFRLLPFFKKACRLNKDALTQIQRQWLRVVPPPVGPAPDPEVEPPVVPPVAPAQPAGGA